MELRDVGTAGLQGWRRTVGDRVAGPASRHTPLDVEQARALIGVVFFLLALRYVLRTARRLATASS